MANEGDKKSTGEITNPSMLRRQFILENVRAYGAVTLQQIQQEGINRNAWKVAKQSIIDDAKWFEFLGLGVVRSGKQFTSTAPEMRYWVYKEREKLSKEGKSAIAKYVKAMVCHLESHRSDKDMATIEDIKTQLERNPSVSKFIEHFGSKHSRHIALDAGTTTKRISEVLNTEFKEPFPKIRVLTNSPRIERELEAPDCPVEVLGLGGTLRKHTCARTGYLAEACLRAWSHFGMDISFVGATHLKLDSHGNVLAFACDSEAEAVTKAMFLETAKDQLRCIVMDSSKFYKRSSSAFVFAPASSDSVNLVITDDHLNSASEADKEAATKCMESLSEQGIAVVRAKRTDRP